MPRFLIPIPGFTVPGPWTVGRVTMHPGTTGAVLVDGIPSPKLPDGYDLAVEVDKVLAAGVNGTVAEIPDAPDISDAVAAVRIALDALRLFHHSRRVVRSLPFGLPGDLAHGIVDYIVDNGDVALTGWTRVGDPSGGGFAQDDQDAWDQSDAFQFLSDAIADPTRSEAARRAAVGTQLFSRAVVEQRADIKMLGIVGALEAWVLNRQTGAQTLRLARHVSWFGCGLHDGSLCGRDRPVCPYLRLEPESKADRKRLDTLRDLGNTHGGWRCSEWHQVVDWYDARSDAAHGNDPIAVDPQHASQAGFWVARYLSTPILDWLRTHPDDPVGDLHAELSNVEHPAGWAVMLEALDADPPPPVPPPL